MELTWIHAAADRGELRALTDIISADMELSQKPGAELMDNSWSVTMQESAWEQIPVKIGHYIYAPGTEWGGPVCAIKHNTRERTVTVQGVTWRGLLFQRRIMPPEGQAYLSFSNTDALAVVRGVIGSSYGSLFAVKTGSCGVNVSASYRFQTMAAGLTDTLRAAGLRLDIAYDNITAAAVVDVKPVTALQDLVEISQDYGVQFATVEGDIEAANHCLALGSGELTDRQVLDVYRVGNTYSTMRPASITDEKIRTVVLDYPNAESTADLLASAFEKLKETAPDNKITIDELMIEVEAQLGDLLGVRDRLTGLTATAETTGKILTIQAGRVSVAMTVNTVGTALKQGYTWQTLKESDWTDAKTNTWEHYYG